MERNICKEREQELTYVLFLRVTRVVGFLVAGFLQYKYNLPITIGKITIYMALRDVSIKTKHFWIVSYIETFVLNFQTFISYLS